MLRNPGTGEVIEICGKAEELALSVICIPETSLTLIASSARAGCHLMLT
jgi:hypothetical protein